MATAAPTPRAAPTSTPTPTQHENDALRIAIATNTVPAPTYSHAMDGSPIDPQSLDPTDKTTSFP